VESAIRSGPLTLCGWTAALILLSACPQLLDDDFAANHQGVSDPDASGETRSSSSGGKGGSAGSSGNPSSGSGGGSAAENGLRAALAHRYSFDGIGDVVLDSVAGADAKLFRASLDGRGVAVLTGDDEFVNLPNNLLSSSNDKTIETWLTWNGGDRWQRIFDFGSSDEGETQRGQGATYLYLTPRGNDDRMLLGYSTDGIEGETRVISSSALPIGSSVYVAVVVDSRHDSFSLYVNGALDGTHALEQRLSEIQDFNSWLGLGQFSADPGLSGQLDEFRLYDRALTAEEIALSFELGANTLLPPP
jgi:concanavalin A-like lectin/glucanase superfamily protein